MKAALEYLQKEHETSFTAKLINHEYYPVPWHYHPEYELVLITESTGKRFIYDRITDFQPGDLVLIGPLLPHLYRNGPEYYQPDASFRAKAIVVHFSENTFGDTFFSLPETTALQTLLANSVRGLNIIGETNKIVSAKLFELLELSGLARWLKLLEILNTIAESSEYTLISSHVVTGKNELDSERLNKVIEYVMTNYSEDIYIADVAKMINMAENSFSRYFSRQTGKSFTSFIREIRLHNASKLLIDNSMKVSDICFKSGFNNLSNFNKQFKKMYGVNPWVYRKQYCIKPNRK